MEPRIGRCVLLVLAAAGLPHGAAAQAANATVALNLTALVHAADATAALAGPALPGDRKSVV